MKPLVVVALCLVAYASFTPSSSTSIQSKDWILFKKQHNKTYKSAAQERISLSYFLKAKIRIEEHNTMFQAGQASFHQKLNKYSDMSLKEFTAKRNGYNRTLKRKWGHSRKRKIRPTAAPITLSATLDWKASGAVTPVDDQGQCGSCWTYAATGALEGQYFKKTGKLISLSKQYLLDCDAFDSGCNGGSPQNAFTYVGLNGIALEASYPYTGSQGNCRKDITTISDVTFTGFTEIKEGDETALKQAVANVGPIAAAIDASHRDFMNYGGGIYASTSCNSANVNHGVLVVGYGTINGQDYWLVKNSWGTTWGISGYFFLARNRNNMCGIATDASYPTY